MIVVFQIILRYGLDWGRGKQMIWREELYLGYFFGESGSQYSFQGLYQCAAACLLASVENANPALKKLE